MTQTATLEPIEKIEWDDDAQPRYPNIAALNIRPDQTNGTPLGNTLLWEQRMRAKGYETHEDAGYGLDTENLAHLVPEDIRHHYVEITHKRWASTPRWGFVCPFCPTDRNLWHDGHKAAKRFRGHLLPGGGCCYASDSSRRSEAAQGAKEAAKMADKASRL
jgi:hypothetical protein